MKEATICTVSPSFVFHTGHLVVNEATICKDRPLCLLHRPLSGEGGHYVHIQATLASCTDHLVVKEATMSTLGRPVCLSHVPISDEGGHYVHSQATLSFTQAT